MYESSFVRRMERGFVEHLDVPTFNRCFMDICVSLKLNLYMANTLKALIKFNSEAWLVLSCYIR